MNNENAVQSNPNDQQTKEDAVFGSENFFDELESGVNGMVSEGSQPAAPTTEATHSDSGPEQVTHNTSKNGSNVDWERLKQRRCAYVTATQKASAFYACPRSDEA